MRLSFLNTLNPVSSVLLSVQARLTVLPEAEALRVAGVVGGRFCLSHLIKLKAPPAIFIKDIINLFLLGFVRINGVLFDPSLKTMTKFVTI